MTAPKLYTTLAFILVALLGFLLGVFRTEAAQVATSIYGIYVSSNGNVGILSYAPHEKLTLSQKQNIATELELPVIATVATSSTGGSMATGTYYYVVTAHDGQGETLRSTQATAANVVGPTGAVNLTWGAVPGATSYSVYRSATSGSFISPSLVFSTTTLVATDTLATAASGAPQAYTNAYIIKMSATSSSWMNAGPVGFGTTSPATTVDAVGYIRASLNATGTACSTEIAGAIFYNNANSHLWSCNGTDWVTIY